MPYLYRLWICAALAVNLLYRPLIVCNIIAVSSADVCNRPSLTALADMGDCKLDALLDMLDDDDEAFEDDEAVDAPEATVETVEEPEAAEGDAEEDEMARKLREMEEQVRMMREQMARKYQAQKSLSPKTPSQKSDVKKTKSQTSSSSSTGSIEGESSTAKMKEINMFTASSSAPKSR